MVSVSIQSRLAIFFFVVLGTGYALFALAISQVPRNILADIDRELVFTADEAINQARATGRADIRSVQAPNRLRDLDSANTFFQTINLDQRIVGSSANLDVYNQLLDPDGLGESPVFHTLRINEQLLRVYTVPYRTGVGDNGRVIGYIQVGELLGKYGAFRNLNTTVLLIGGATLTASLFAIVWLIPAFLRPLNEITDVAVQITSADDLSRRIPDNGQTDEIGHLTSAFNHLMERLEDLFRTQQRLLADVSHELRTPLTTIRGNVDLMRYMGTGDPESLAIIQDEIDRMIRLVNNLLTLARADTGSLPIQKERVELDTVFLEVYRQASPLATQVTLSIGEVDQACVLGDRDRLKQLMLNLVDNAITYTPAGGKVTMSLSVAGDTATIAVADTGIGIPLQDLPHIFDRFYRVDKARTRSKGGSGLGLAIVKSIVEAHQGHIDVDSQVGVGSTFTVQLPLQPITASNSSASPRRVRV